MKSQDVKVGMVVYCRACERYSKVTKKKLWMGELLVALDGESLADADGQGHTIDVLRPLTAREKGLTK